ncbi:MAG: cobalamin-dependent protein [Longimicrobiales bacterium]
MSRASNRHRHPIRVVTRRTGLSADLLRAWERRYEVVTPSRSEGGRRLYSDVDIERLRLLYKATLSGRSIGQVAEFSTKALGALVRQDAEADIQAELAVKKARELERTTQVSTADFLADAIPAVERLDAVALEAALRRAAVALPAAAFLDAFVVGLLERVGTRWREGTLRPVHGHLTFPVVRRVLERVIENATSAFATPNLVIATPAGQAHELGALLAAASAAAEGWRVTYLGADLPAEDIAEAAAGARARAVALSVVFPSGDPAVGDELRRLRTALPKDLAVMVGGAASSAYGAVLDEIGAVRLNDLESFRATLRAVSPPLRRAGSAV